MSPKNPSIKSSGYNGTSHEFRKYLKNKHPHLVQHLKSLCPAHLHFKPFSPDLYLSNITCTTNFEADLRYLALLIKSKVTVEKDPSPRIFPNLKSSGRFFRGCGGCCPVCCCRELELDLDSAVVPSMLDPCLLPQVEMTDGVLASAWFLTIEGDEQEHNTTLDWIGTASY